MRECRKQKSRNPIRMPTRRTLGKSNRRTDPFGGIIGWMIILLVILVVVSGVVFVIKKQVFSQKNLTLAIDEYKVSQTSFEIVIPTSGELEANEKVEVRNQVESRTTIKWIIDEGSYVKAGDLLLELVSEEIKRQIIEKEKQIDSQSNEVKAAESDLVLQESENDSAEQAARVKYTMAEIELNKWSEGDDAIKMNELDLAIETATRNQRRYTKEYQESIDLADRGFISDSQKEDDYIKMIEADAELIKANLNKATYINYTRTKERTSRESDLKQAEDELKRVMSSNKTKYEKKLNDAKYKKNTLLGYESDLARLESQFENCSVKAPIDGLVIYGTTGGRRWWRSEDALQIGQDVYPNQLFFTLPDTSKLVALVKVHESQAGLLKIGMPVTIRVDAKTELSLTGKVQKVGVMAEQSFGTQVREYSVEILIDGENEWELKPAMRCKASIFLGKLENVIGVPLQAVFTSKRQHYVWMRDGSKYVKQPVKIGKASETMIEIKEGIKTGQTVLLREPLPGEIGS